MVVSSENFNVELEEWIGVQSWVNKAGMSTHRCGTPGFRMGVEEMRSHILTFWDLFVRKSIIHVHSAASIPKLLNLHTSL